MYVSILNLGIIFELTNVFTRVLSPPVHIFHRVKTFEHELAENEQLDPDKKCHSVSSRFSLINMRKSPLRDRRSETHTKKKAKGYTHLF